MGFDGGLGCFNGDSFTEYTIVDGLEMAIRMTADSQVEELSQRVKEAEESVAKVPRFVCRFVP